MSLKQSNSKLEPTQPAPDFNLKNFEGQEVDLNDLDNFDGVLVIFMCNHCPYVKSQTDEIRKLAEEFSSIAVVGINPNTETHPEDSVEKMPEFVEEHDLDRPNFFYLADNSQEVAEAYDAQCTPDSFLLDWRHRLQYHGRLNDKKGPDTEAENHEMKDVIEKMLKRKNPPKQAKPSQGCSIKWKN